MISVIFKIDTHFKSSPNDLEENKFNMGKITIIMPVSTLSVANMYGTE